MSLTAPSPWSPPYGDPSIILGDAPWVLVIHAYTGYVPTYWHVQVFADGATDGAPGSELAGFFGAGVDVGGGSWRMGPIVISARTLLRYRVRAYIEIPPPGASQYTDWTSLANGRIIGRWAVHAPSAPWMDKGPDSPTIAGSLSVGDTDDYISGVEIEVYRDTAGGAVTMWAPGVIGIGGSPTRSETPYAGVALSPGMVLRWHMRHVDRDATVGEWTSWQYTTVVAEAGPDNMSPLDPSTKLLTLTPDLTIANSVAFDAYRWRLFRGGSEIHDSGELAMASGTSIVVTPTAGLLAWGDGAATPLEWEAAIHRTGAGGGLGPFSPRRGLRIDTLPPATLAADGWISGYVQTADPTYRSPYTDPDRLTYAEDPVVKEWEIRQASTPAGTGTLVKHINDLTPAETEQLGAAFVPTVDVAYDLRVRYRDDATPAVETTMAANSSAAATNIKVTSVTGMVAGQYLTLEAGTADEEARLITTVGTAGAGGSGITVDHGYTLAHTSGDTAKVHHWGPWSAWLTYIYHPPPVVAASSPADAGTVNDPTGNLVWTFTSSRVQDYAIVRIYEVEGGVDNLVWEATQQGVAVTYQVPPYLLATGKTYAWTVQAYDDFGFSGTTTRRTFSTSLTAPVQPAGLTATPSSAASKVALSWTGIYDAIVRALIPASYWRLHESSSTMSDEMGLAAGTVTGTTRGVSSLHDAADPDKAVQFDAGADYITFGDNHDFPALAPFTVCGLYKAAAIGSNDRLILAKLNGSTDGWGLRIDTDRTVEFMRGASSTFQTINGATALAIGTTYHVAARFDGTNLSLLINGVSDATPVASAASMPGNANSLQMGNTSSSLSGVMDDWAVYARALTDAEIAMLAAAKLGWETYFDHYRVWWQEVDGEWARIDGGPEVPSDGRPKLTVPTLDHFGARLGSSSYRVEASNGAQASTYATTNGTLASVAAGRWVHVVPSGTPLELRVIGAQRDAQAMAERFDPPGRNSSIHLVWGHGPHTVSLAALLRPSTEGDITDAIDDLMSGDAGWLKAPAGWLWDPLWSRAVSRSDTPREGGMLAVGVTFEATDVP